LLHCDEWDRIVALPRHKFVTGATLLQLGAMQQKLQTHTEHLSSPKYLVCNKSKTKGAVQQKL
jgi:transcription initiation factor IIE alpha subunit